MLSETSRKLENILLALVNWPSSYIIAITCISEIESGIRLIMSSFRSLSIASRSVSSSSFRARYLLISSLVGFIGSTHNYSSKYGSSSAHTCGLPVRKSWTPGESRTICCNEWRNSGRRCTRNSSKASIQIYVLSGDDSADLKSLRTSGSVRPRPPTCFRDAWKAR